MKVYLCPDCSGVLKHYYQRLWDCGRLSVYPALYCTTCKRTHYQTILDLPVVRRDAARQTAKEAR